MREITERNTTDSNVHEYEPPIEMRQFVAVLLNEGLGSITKTEAITRIDRGRFYYYLKKSKNKNEFNCWYKKQRNDFFSTWDPAMAKALVRKAIEGDVSAMRLFYELRGEIRSGGVNIQATAFPGSRQPLVIVLDKSAEQENVKPAIDTTFTVETKKLEDAQPPGS